MGENNNATHLRILAVQMPPYSTIRRSGKDGTFVLGGTGFHVVDAVMKSLGIRYTVVYEPGFVGVKLANGSWTGMIRRFLQNEADMSLSFFHRTPIRETVVDFTTWLVESESFIFGGALPPETTDIGSIVKIYSAGVWFGILGTLLLYVFVTAVEVRVVRSKPRIEFADRQELSRMMFMYIAALFFEGTPRDPATFKGRLLYGIWWLMMLVLSNSFCGHSRAMMMSAKESLRVQSLDQLSSLTDRLTPITVKDSSYESFFRNGTDAQRKIHKSLKLGKGIMGLVTDDYLDLMKEGSAVILYDSTITKSAFAMRCLEAEVNNVYISKKSFLSTYCYLGVRKKFEKSLLRQIDNRIRWLFESNLIFKWTEKENRNFNFCLLPDFQSDLETPLSLKSTRVLFLFHLVCMAVSFLCFIVEIVLGHFPVRAKKRRTRKAILLPRRSTK